MLSGKREEPRKGELRITEGSLSERTTPSERKLIVVRGNIDPAPLDAAFTPRYQRDPLLGTKHEELKTAIRTVGVPDVTYGHRGYNVEETDDGVYVVTGFIPI